MAEKNAPKKRFKLSFGPAAKQGVKVALYVGAGAVAAKAGGALAKRASTTVAEFAAAGEYHEAAVEAGAGALLAGVGLAIAGKVGGMKKAVAAAPFVFGGVVLAAAAPVIAPKLIAGLDSAFDMLLPSPTMSATTTATAIPKSAGLFFDEVGLGGRMPGGLFAEPSQGLQGRLPQTLTMPGGLYFGAGDNIVGNRLAPTRL